MSSIHLNLKILNKPMEYHYLKKNQYERIITVTCPTCLGKGKLSQSEAEKNVALIPAQDKRLKPRRTKRYLGIKTFARFCGNPMSQYPLDSYHGFLFRQKYLPR